MAREEGGRSEDVLFDSTGVLLRLPMADMLSMIPLKAGEAEEADAVDENRL
jgi:hypothetical protein